MRCRICGKKPVIFMKHHRLALCSEHFINWFEKYTERTIKEFRMFKKGDKILVAVSGGKDSLALWFVLRKLGYEADGLYIDLGIGDYSKKSFEKAKLMSERLSARLIVKRLSEDLLPLPSLTDMSGREACSLCGVLKRYNFNKTASEEGYDVVATGHNLDDEASSLLSNVINWNIKYLGRKEPVLKEEKGFVRKVKPFCKFMEKETALYCILNGIDFIEEECPFSEDASTIFYKHVLNEIEERFPGTKLRFYLEYVKKVRPLFAGKEERSELLRCKVCGQPSPSEICPVCKLKSRVLK